MGGRRGLPVRPVTAARRRLFDRHAASDSQRITARRTRVLVHAHRHHRALPADARQGGVLSDGLGRQRPADRAPRAELLRRALRSLAAVQLQLRPAGYAAEAASLGLAAELHRAVQPAHRGRRKGVRAALEVPRPVGRLVDDLRDDRPARAARVAVGVPASARTGSCLSGRSADALGCRLQDRRRAGRARGSRSRRRLPPREVRARGRRVRL